MDSATFTMPCSIEHLGQVSAPLVLTRKFGYPGRIDEDEHIWLTVVGLASQAHATVNGHRLGDLLPGDWTKEITAYLGQRNQLDLRLLQLPAHGLLWQEVAMEIRRGAYLENTSAQRLATGDITLTGLVRGTCERPLELYALLERRHVGYSLVEADPYGKVFQMTIPAEEAAGQLLRLELVNVSQIWYAQEIQVEPHSRTE